MKDCIFCKIVKKEIPTDIIMEDDDIIAFNDINPIAPDHILIIPKVHIKSVTELNDTNYYLLSRMANFANDILKNVINNKNGCRWVINAGIDGGQTVFHLHLHLIAGRKFSWPPG